MVKEKETIWWKFEGIFNSFVSKHSMYRVRFIR